MAREYVENMYGMSDSPLHEGLGTDRLVAIWDLDDPRVDARLGGRGAPPPTWDDVRHLPRAFEASGDGPRPGAASTVDPGVAGAMLIPVPADIQRIKASDPAVAAAWRVATRRAFDAFFSLGWEVRELVRGPAALCHYLLRPSDAGA